MLQPSRWKLLLVEYPARAFDALVHGYMLFLGAGAIICLVTAALWLAAWLAGVPLPGNPPPLGPRQLEDWRPRAAAHCRLPRTDGLALRQGLLRPE